MFWIFVRIASLIKSIISGNNRDQLSQRQSGCYSDSLSAYTMFGTIDDCSEKLCGVPGRWSRSPVLQPSWKCELKCQLREFPKLLALDDCNGNSRTLSSRISLSVSSETYKLQEPYPAVSDFGNYSWRLTILEQYLVVQGNTKIG